MLTINDPYQIPVRRIASDVYSDLFWLPTVREFCAGLLALPRLDSITPEEYAAVEAVAAGGTWPVPEAVYTSDDWTRHKNFGAVPGQEVTEDIYEYMFDVMPIAHLPRCGVTREYNSGFLSLEAADHDPQTGRARYMAFGKRGGKFYYIGHLPVKVDDGDSRYD